MHAVTMNFDRVKTREQHFFSCEINEIHFGIVKMYRYGKIISFIHPSLGHLLRGTVEKRKDPKI